VVKTTGAFLTLAVAAAVPIAAPHAEYVLGLLFLVFLYGTMATSWNVLGGFAGQVSFGHAAFLGIGAYTTAILVGLGWPLWTTFPLAGGLAALFSLVIGVPAFRLRGPYFAIATIGVGEATRLIALNWSSLTGGASGLTMASTPPLIVQYYVALALCAVAVAVAAWIKSSRFGYALAAIRSDPDAAETLGVDTTLAKTQALMVSAFMLGVAGSVYAMHYLFVSPDSAFGFKTSISLVIMPIVGGIGTIAGPLLGAAIFTVLREQLEAYFPYLDLLAFGVILCAIVLFEPRGLLGLFDRLVKRRG
jgi:branched-chain amino acid transport system permease protein